MLSVFVHEKIGYYIRIRNNLKVFLSHKNKIVKASHWFNGFRANEFVYQNKLEYINEPLCYLSGCKLCNDNLKQDF